MFHSDKHLSPPLAIALIRYVRYYPTLAKTNRFLIGCIIQEERVCQYKNSKPCSNLLI